MSKIDPKRIAQRYLTQTGRNKTAGEVIFKKDRSGDGSAWAYHDIAPTDRKIQDDFNYSPKNMKPLVQVLRSSLAALGHSLSAYNTFAKIKSARVSPDGNLGGKGYIQKIQDMRKQYMNIVEALSALTDTLYDETNAPHWAVMSRQEDPEDRREVKELIEDAEQIRDNPQEWADEEMEEEFESGGASKGRGKTAAQIHDMLQQQRLAYEWLAVHRDQLPGGLADLRHSEDFDAGQLAKGVKVEMEHTKDKATAQEIAMDHLTEDPRYYDKLETIEGDSH